MNIKVLLPVFLLTGLSIGCKKKDFTPQDLCETSFHAFTRIGQPQLQQSPNSLNALIDSSDYAANSRICTTTEYEWAPGYDEPLLLNPTSSIYPGVILGANTLVTGGYSVITGDRGPLVLSTNFQNLGGLKSVNVATASLSAVRNGISDLLQNKVIGPTSANLSISTSRVYNESTLKSALSVAVDVIPGDINSTFNWNSSTVKNRMVARFTQVYYTVDIDLPSDPRNFWTTCPDASVFNGQVPVVVSSVKYGRSAILTIESTTSFDSLETAIDLALRNVNVNADVSYKSIINNSNFNLTVLGGNALSAVNINSFDGLRNYVVSGANYSDQNPAEPLSYKMKFLDDYSDAYVVLYSKFNVQECQVVGVGQYIIPNYSTSMICPVKSSGDDSWEYDVDQTIQAEIKIDPNDNTRLVLEINWALDGTSFDATEANTTRTFQVYTAPTGKKISSIDSDTYSEVAAHSADKNITDVYHHITPDVQTGNVGPELVNEFRAMVNTANKDLDGCNTSNTHMYVDLRDIAITLSNQ